jgi:hypothetical protein
MPLFMVFVWLSHGSAADVATVATPEPAKKKSIHCKHLAHILGTSQTV